MSTAPQLPQLIAHRGAPWVAPENTLAALRAAAALGATWVEFDVQLTQSGDPVVFHDDTLDRTTDGHGALIERRTDEVLGLDAGGWFSDRFKGEPVPTFSEYVQCASALKVGINIELKGTRATAAQLSERVAAALARYWSDTLPPPLISSFSVDCLQAMQRCAPQYPRAYALGAWGMHWLEVVDALDCVSLHVNHHVLNAKRIAQVRATGRKVLAYTVNDCQRAKTLFEMGVVAIFSDDPQLLSAD